MIREVSIDVTVEQTSYTADGGPVQLEYSTQGVLAGFIYLTQPSVLADDRADIVELSVSQLKKLLPFLMTIVSETEGDSSVADAEFDVVGNGVGG